MSSSNKFQNPTSRINELWQTDFTSLQVVGWGWYFLSTVLDDYSRCIISCRLTNTMAVSDVTETLEDALGVTGLSEARVRHRPHLLSDNGPRYISGELKFWLKQRDIEQTRVAPYHPMTQGRIERYHESLDNVTPAAVYEVRRNDILDQRALVKARTMAQRKIHNLRLAG